MIVSTGVLPSPVRVSFSQNADDQIDGTNIASLAYKVINQVHPHCDMLKSQEQLLGFQEQYMRKVTHIEMFKDMYQNKISVKVIMTVIFMIVGAIIVPSLILYLIVCQKTRERNAIFRCVHEQALSRPMQEITKNRWWEFGEDNIFEFLQRGKEELSIERVFLNDIEFHKNNSASKKYYQQYISMTKKWKSLLEKINKPFQQWLTFATKIAEKNNFSFEDFRSMIILACYNMLQHVDVSDKDRERLVELILKEPIEKCAQEYASKCSLNDFICQCAVMIQQASASGDSVDIGSFFSVMEQKIEQFTQNSQQVCSYLLKLSQESLTIEEQKREILRLLRQHIVLGCHDSFQTLLPFIDEHIKSLCLTETLEKLREDLATLSSLQNYHPLHSSSFLKMQKQFAKVYAQRRKVHTLALNRVGRKISFPCHAPIRSRKKAPIRSRKKRLQSKVESLSFQIEDCLHALRVFSIKEVNDLHHSYAGLLQRTVSPLLWLDVINQEGLMPRGIDSTYQQYEDNCKALERGLSQIKDYQKYQELPNKIMTLFITASLPSDTPSLPGDVQGLGMMLSKLPEQVRHQWADLFAEMMTKYKCFDDMVTSINGEGGLEHMILGILMSFDSVASNKEWTLKDINNPLQGNDLSLDLDYLHRWWLTEENQEQIKKYRD